MIRTLYLSAFACFIISCTVEPQEITYGQDGCHFCKMTIVDRHHAAQIVTVKGKAFKYDAIECMMNHLNKWDGPEIEFYLVSDYSIPGTLTDARKAEFLISESIPSPMGEFLTAFKEKTERNKIKKQLGGQSLTWNELMKEFKVTR